MQPELFVGIGIGAVAMAVIAAAVVWQMYEKVFFERMDHATRLAGERARLEYEVIPVGFDDAPAFRKTPLPVWRDFSEMVLQQECLAAHHERVRKDAVRLAALYPGKALFVIVRRMPCPV
jgi:hypothetical protein